MWSRTMIAIQGRTTLPIHTALQTQSCDGFPPSLWSGSDPTFTMSWSSLWTASELNANYAIITVNIVGGPHGHLHTLDASNGSASFSMENPRLDAIHLTLKVIVSGIRIKVSQIKDPISCWFWIRLAWPVRWTNTQVRETLSIFNPTISGSQAGGHSRSLARCRRFPPASAPAKPAARPWLKYTKHSDFRGED